MTSHALHEASIQEPRRTRTISSRESGASTGDGLSTKTHKLFYLWRLLFCTVQIS